METIGYICLLFMGLTLGLVGAGGSILTIPILVYLFKIPMIIATTYSLVIVGSSAFIATIRYRHIILFKKAIIFTIPSIIGIFCARSYLIPNLPEFLWGLPINQVLMLLLLVFMALAGYFMIKDFKFHTDNKAANNKATQIKLISIGLCLGTIMGLLGAGGGFLIIPTLVLWMRLNMQEAVPTSLFIITINSLIGTLSNKHSLDSNDWSCLLGYLSFALVGMFIGIYLGKYVNGHNLKQSFGWFVWMIAIVIATKEFIL